MRLTERKSKNGGKEALFCSTGGETPYIHTNIGDMLTCDCTCRKGNERIWNKDKNSKFNIVDPEWLSVRCCQVLVLELQLLGMSRGTVHHQSALLTVCHLATQQVWSTSKWRHSALPSSISACRVGCQLAMRRRICQNLESCRRVLKIDKNFQRKGNKIETRTQSFKTTVRILTRILMAYDV